MNKKKKIILVISLFVVTMLAIGTCLYVVLKPADVPANTVVDENPEEIVEEIADEEEKQDEIIEDFDNVATEEDIKAKSEEKFYMIDDVLYSEKELKDAEIDYSDDDLCASDVYYFKLSDGKELLTSDERLYFVLAKEMHCASATPESEEFNGKLLIDYKVGDTTMQYETGEQVAITFVGWLSGVKVQ